MLKLSIGCSFSFKMLRPQTLLLARFNLFIPDCNIPQWDCSLVKSNGALAQHNGKSVVLIMAIKH